MTAPTIKNHQLPLTGANFSKLKKMYPGSKGMQDLFWGALLDYLDLELTQANPSENKDVDREFLIKQYQIPLPESMFRKLMKKTNGTNTQEALQIAILEILKNMKDE